MADKKAVPGAIPGDLMASAADLAAILALGGNVLVSEPIIEPSGDTLIFVGKDLQSHVIPALNPVLPEFVDARETFVEPDSFVEYIKTFKSSRSVAIASLQSNSIRAVLDYHGPARMDARDTATPGTCRHVVTLACPWDPDYLRWRSIFNKDVPQTALMEFLEDMIHTIHAPLAGDLLDAVGNVELDRASKFKSARNLRNGTVQFIFAESEEPLVVRLPEIITIVTPVFQGGNPQAIDVRLRYGLDRGALAFKLVLTGAEKLERDAFRSIGERVRTDTATPVFYAA